MTPKTNAAPPAPPRERIIAAAAELFQKHGIRGIGVDAIDEPADARPDVDGVRRLEVSGELGRLSDVAADRGSDRYLRGWRRLLWFTARNERNTEDAEGGNA